MKKFGYFVFLPICTLLIGFFSGIAFVNNWLVINKVIPDYKMFQTPLNADVWGTVSDWTIVIVTIFSGALIWNTLKAQIDSNKISQNNYRLSIFPNFTISEEIYKDSDGNYFTVTLNNNKALNFILYEDTSLNRFINTKKIIPILHLNVGNAVKIYCNSNEIPKINGALQTNFITFSFEDITGNKYEQNIFIHHSHDSLALSTPKLQNI